jgi:uncharacterized protein (TIGR03437 family)
MKSLSISRIAFIALVSVALLFGLRGTARSQQPTTSTGPGPSLLPPQFQHAVGDPVAGQGTFRFETFGNQKFWTDAMQLPQGIAAAGVTPLQALQLGLNVNVANLNPATAQALVAALQQVQSGTPASQTALGNPAVTLSLINQNAVIGVVAFDPSGNVKPAGNTGTLNIAGGDRVGLTCAVCHAITDNSVLPPTPAFNTKGSVGHEVDGPANHGIDVGTILSVAQRPLAYYPMYQLQYKALNGATIGRGSFPGLLTTSTGFTPTIPTNAQVVQYLTGTDATSGQRYYPVGQFDAFPDGVGNPTHIPALFRTDLSAPWGDDGGTDILDNFNNTVYTVSLDPTSLLTPGGQEFLHIIAGPVGDEIAADYQTVLRQIGVIPNGVAATSVVPYVTAQDYLEPATEYATVGRRVDNTKLLNLNAYLNSLQAPQPGPFNAAMAAQGQVVFSTSAAAGGGGCTGCHQLDPNKFVPPMVVPIQRIYPGYNPTVVFNRVAPFSPIQKSFGGPSPFYDNRFVVVDASRIGGIRGAALPLKLDLARRTSLLSDDEIVGVSFDDAADQMMNPAKRDPKAVHPFFVADPTQRAAVIEFMKSLGTSPPTFTAAGVANYASYMGGALAPGEVIAISGTALGVGMANAAMSSTSVTFDGVAAPLVSVTTTQITAIVPFNVAGKTTTQLQVTVGSQSAPAIALPVAPAAPGIFTLNGAGSGQAAVLNQDGTVNSASNPAPAGTEVAIYATGGGQTSPAGVNGQIVSTPAPLNAATVAVSIGGQSAQVAYAGGAPGLYAGILQVNAIIPSGATSGSNTLVLNIGGVASPAGVTVAVK